VNGGSHTLVGSVAEVRLKGNTILADTGHAGAVSLSGALYPSTLAGQPAVAVQAGAATNPSVALAPTANFVQSSTSAPTATSIASNLGHPVDFVLTRVTVETSAQGSFTPTTAGTRVFLFDGTLESLSGASITDGAGGVAIPGLGGISGTNNSTSGFASVGAGFTPVGGTTTAVTVNTPSSTGAGGVGAPAGLPAPAPDVTGVQDRSTQDAAGGEAPSGQPGDDEVLFGTRASAQADLGRGGSVSGSAINVFKRRYRVATSSSDAVCMPGAVQPVPVEGKPARECPVK
jgi:hypothetical protein